MKSEYVWKPPTEIAIEVIKEYEINLDDVGNVEKRFGEMGVPRWVVALTKLFAKLMVGWYLLKYRTKTTKEIREFMTNLIAYEVCKRMAGEDRIVERYVER